METLSKILIWTNVICIISLLICFSTINTYKLTIDIQEDTNTNLRNNYDEYREVCGGLKTEYSDMLIDMTSELNDNWQWAFDTLNDECDKAIKGWEDLYNKYC